MNLNELNTHTHTTSGSLLHLDAELHPQQVFIS